MDLASKQDRNKKKKRYLKGLLLQSVVPVASSLYRNEKYFSISVLFILYLLQVMKRNSFLIHENAELYLEVRRLRQKLDGNDIVTRQISREVGLVETAQDAAETVQPLK